MGQPAAADPGPGAEPAHLHVTQYHYDGNGNVDARDVQNRDKDNSVVTANEWFTTTYAYTLTRPLTSITEEIDVGRHARDDASTTTTTATGSA